ncbi:hypothetical protein GQ457_18G010100 [Hibiscus cannabinus]
MQITSFVEARRQEDQAQFSVQKVFTIFRVVYRSWTFGFDSDIPRVTTSSRFCDYTRSRGLHLLVSEPGYAIIGMVSEAPIAIHYHWKKIPRNSVRGGGQAPGHLDEVEIEQGNEETLPPPPSISGEAYEGDVVVPTKLPKETFVQCILGLVKAFPCKGCFVPDYGIKEVPKRKVFGLENTRKKSIRFSNHTLNLLT